MRFVILTIFSSFSIRLAIINIPNRYFLCKNQAKKKTTYYFIDVRFFVPYYSVIINNIGKLSKNITNLGFLCYT